ncbi:interleukin-32 isoform X2 [Sciurus carolinensis]|uniref:interleukin-32 isoform X2 n=1 Tax=Sciurus carolinensis TaxID=30640 RepID=UPI001FB53CDC|nr:interleukin-32 isoform X2 [Sciurus carolinensis]
MVCSKHKNFDTWLDDILNPHAKKGQILQSTVKFQDQISKDILDTMDVIYQKSNPDSTPLPPDAKKKLQRALQDPDDEGPGVQKPKETFGDKVAENPLETLQPKLDQGNQTQAEKKKEELLSQKEGEEVFGEVVLKLFQDILRIVQKKCEALLTWMKQTLGGIMESVYKALQEFCSYLAKYFSGV